MKKPPAGSWKDTPERPGLKCPIHQIMLVDGITNDGIVESSRYCLICTPLICVDGVRLLYKPKAAPPPEDEESLW